MNQIETEGSGRMQRSRAHRAAAVAIAFTLSACGGDVVPGDERSTESTRDAEPAVITVNCPEEVEELVSTLEDLDSRLNVGLNFQSYSERVGDTRVAYDRIDFEEVDSGCIERVGVPAEDAMNAYIEAYNIWNACIGDSDCENESITPDLQAEWADATQLINEASDGLEQ